MLERKLYVVVSTLISTACQSAPLELRRAELDSGKIFISCSFDDVRDSCFLDTGSTNTILANKPEFREYPIVGKIKYKSASGVPEEINEIHINKVVIGGREIGSVNVGRSEINPPSASMIGINEISSEPFSLSFKSKPQINFGHRTTAGRTLEVLDKGILAIPLKIGEQPEMALFDTGAGLSAVDKEFVKAHADLFSFIQDIPNGTDGTGNTVFLKLYRIKQIKIGGLVFHDENILAMDFDVVRKHISKTINFIVGFNLITKGNWHFDVKNKSWANE